MILYSEINVLADCNLNNWVNFLPPAMRNEIRRKKFLSDQKATLIGRLMLFHNLKREGRINLIAEWQRDQSNKPYINGWKFFNISHSYEIVVFASDDKSIGIDIERLEEINYLEISEHFHIQEREFIMNAECTQSAFYEIWVKKEAFLKAVGIGITNGLKEFNCIGDEVRYKAHIWYFQKLEIHKDYMCYLCTSKKEYNIIINEFHLDNVYLLYN
ncbi:MAG: 4'-phosphopantetheinyl transferase superfamily protein [Bacteroidota bacterium]